MKDFTVTYAGNSWATHDPLVIDLGQPPKGGSALLRQITTGSSTASWDVNRRMDILRQMLEQIGHAVSLNWITVPSSVDVQDIETPEDALVAQRVKNEAAIQLLKEWMEDESGYDERMWPIAKKVLEENRLSYRVRFDD